MWAERTGLVNQLVVGLRFKSFDLVTNIRIGQFTHTPLSLNTVDGFIFVGTNFRGLKKNDAFVGFKIHGYSIFFDN